MDFITILTFLYGISATISIAAYLPQIYSLIISTGRSEAVSLSSWIIWSFSALTAFSYILFTAGDNIPLLITTFCTCLGTITVTVLTVYNRFLRFSGTLPLGVSTKAAKQLKLFN